MAFTHGAAFVPLAGISSAVFWRPRSWPRSMSSSRASATRAISCSSICAPKSCCWCWTISNSCLRLDQSQNEGAADLLSDVLHHAPGVTLLVTSRERLALPGEWLLTSLG